MSITTIAIYVAVAALIIYRMVYKQIRGVLLSRRSLTILPLILLAVGAASVSPVLGTATPAEIGLLAVEVIVLAGLGVLRSTTTTLSEHAGTTFQKGSAVTIGLWVLTIAVRIGLAALAGVLGVAGPLTSASIALTIGLSIAVQNATTYYRITRRGLPLTDGRRPALVR